MGNVVQQILDSKPGPLAALMEAAWEGGPPETTIEMAAMLAGELDREPGEVLAAMKQAESAVPPEAAHGDRARAPGLSLADVLFEPRTSIETLRAIKEAFKGRRLRSPVATEAAVVSAIYYTAVAAALVCHGIRISELSPESLKQALDWMLDQPWLDPRCRELASRVLAIMAASA